MEPGFPIFVRETTDDAVIFGTFVDLLIRYIFCMALHQPFVDSYCEIVARKRSKTDGMIKVLGLYEEVKRQTLIGEELYAPLIWLTLAPVYVNKNGGWYDLKNFKTRILARTAELDEYCVRIADWCCRRYIAIESSPKYGFRIADCIGVCHDGTVEIIEFKCSQEENVASWWRQLRDYVFLDDQKNGKRISRMVVINPILGQFVSTDVVR